MLSDYLRKKEEVKEMKLAAIKATAPILSMNKSG
jgi:hypothetical protein